MEFAEDRNRNFGESALHNLCIYLAALVCNVDGLAVKSPALSPARELIRRQDIMIDSGYNLVLTG